MTQWAPGPALALYHAGVTVISEIAARFSPGAWAAPTPCPEWRAVDLAAHLRCMADDYHEYLDDAPASRLARLLEASPSPQSLARKLARQNAAELAALPDATGPEHIAAFAASARAYARRLLPAWDLPHHRYHGVVVSVGAMAGAACAEWHLHAWDLARALGKGYVPADPDLLATGWQAGLPHLPLTEVLEAAACCTAAPAAGRITGRVTGWPATRGDQLPAAGAWQLLLQASGRLPTAVGPVHDV